MLDERLGQLHFWLFLIGFHLTFDTLHFAGLAECRGEFIPTSRAGPRNL